MKFLNIIFILIILFLVAFLVIYFGFVRLETWPKEPDRIRIEDISKIRTAMVLYYHDNNLKYFQSSIMPTSLGKDMPEVPKDPKGNPYDWIDNITEPQKFCVWAKLETKDAYYIASHCGAKEVNRQPVSLDNCCELSSP